ncbi:ATP-binding protein [Streptacidiphilus anmyonensis]|uniref:ATP-binding protein n=1 Tax=Streptacidiphilus anmyonensis TaxID=405782 RepID=UPI003F71516F
MLPPARFERLTIPSAPRTEPADAVPEDAIPRVVEGEVVQACTKPVRPRVHRRAAARVHHVATHPRTRAAGLLAVRHGMYTAAGARVLAKRAWESRTTSRHQRMIRTAEELGQHDVAAEWEQRAAQFRASRHQRRMDLLHAPLRLAKALLWSLAIGTGSLLLTGVILAIAQKQPRDLLLPLFFAIVIVRDLVVIAAVVFGIGVYLAPVLILLSFWRAGQQGGTVPRWVLPETERTTEAITPSIVVVALRDLGISQLKKSIQAMSDSAAQMLSLIRPAGCGVEVDVTLPSGVSTDEIQNRRRKLAENLGRHEHELFITIPPAPRTVRLWIADSGALDEPIGASPLVVDPDLTADYYDGRAPWGQDLRGDLASLSLFQMHILVTGLSNQGKTAALRALALWLALDPFVEFRIADLKGVGDWRMFLGLATVLIQGPTDEHVMAATHMAEAGVEEMERRIALVEQSGSNKGITRDMAHTDLNFRPLVFVVDEAQVAYGSPAVGPDKRPYGGKRATSRYFRAVKAIHDQGRAVNVTIWEGTQDPTDENLPKRSREGNHIRASLALGTEQQSKMALGDAPVDAGAAPHKLRQGLDKGTLVVAGSGVELAPGQVSKTIRTHYINGDEAAAIADRAKERRTAVDTASQVAEGEQIDHLQNIADVLDAPRVRTQIVLQRLAERNRAEYADWTFTDLKTFLTDVGAEPRKSDGVMVVDRQLVLDALANRALEEADDYDE